MKLQTVEGLEKNVWRIRDIAPRERGSRLLRLEKRGRTWFVDFFRKGRWSRNVVRITQKMIHLEKETYGSDVQDLFLVLDVAGI
ncbi:MAG TPA: hypothetical protein VFA85_17430 [Terriglobales bacterium]|nr:hypothetical protein [Terriglobales bacterium]